MATQPQTAVNANTTFVESHELTAQTYLNAFRAFGVAITGGTIWQFFRDSTVRYYGGKCAVYYVEYYHNGQRVVIGGNYATNGKPKLEFGYPLDFV